MDIFVVINQMILLFLILAVGYISAKTNIINKAFGDQLSEFIINITMPCMIVASAGSLPEGMNRVDALHMFIIAGGYYVVMPFIAYLIARLLMVNKAERNMYMYMVIWSNIGYMGFPVIRSIFGEGAVFYATIFNLVFNLTNFSLGILLLSKQGKGSMKLKNFCTPGIISAGIALILFLADIKLPLILNNTLKTIGDTTTVLAMIVIGISLSSISLKSLFKDIRIYPFIIIKQLVLPALAWYILRNFPISPFVMGITIIIISMPVGTTAVLFANKYKNNEPLAIRGTFITTLTSVITIPLIAYFIFS